MTGHIWTKMKDPDRLNTLGLLREQCSHCGSIRGLGSKEAVRKVEALSSQIRVTESGYEALYYVQHQSIIEDCDEERIRKLHSQ